ncbi:MAG: GIY-YIG nuclease family protein [Candidatus Marinimicrobia bacterium]|nr:GIY-YIG nuclease family protein [Candidatus Neomarinimicrobiota bacterium]MBT3675498.1 GIY-YIG nuclease family protein [Candidatus Neomarinimicrobiota bacterium]MBT3762790.1 GIY-YIG nuclease family protein [Candidatus Neomarinimicrobiota bacterium]MBT4069270.1 GIY-YIG nuclease family protein [Candidatus Neomarinimicrobiota bacterium]MBT4270411.1 GIY-YIG nuclease family protein [Candidatus Neomarinimicrobiota bacterium]
MNIVLYILKSKASSMRYIGITNNLQNRIKRHRINQSVLKRMLGEFELIYTEDYSDYKSARKREKYFKSGVGREWMNKNL